MNKKTDCTNCKEKYCTYNYKLENSLAFDICKALSRKNKILISALSVAITGWLFTIAGIIFYLIKA